MCPVGALGSLCLTLPLSFLQQTLCSTLGVQQWTGRLLGFSPSLMPAESLFLPLASPLFVWLSLPASIFLVTSVPLPLFLERPFSTRLSFCLSVDLFSFPCLREMLFLFLSMSLSSAVCLHLYPSPSLGLGVVVLLGVLVCLTVSQSPSVSPSVSDKFFHPCLPGSVPFPVFICLSGSVNLSSL